MIKSSYPLFEGSATEHKASTPEQTDSKLLYDDIGPLADWLLGDSRQTESGKFLNL